MYLYIYRAHFSFNVLVKELQGLGLKVDLLDNGDAKDADRVIEKTTEEVERQRDDSVIYAQHSDEEAPPEDLGENAEGFGLEDAEGNPLDEEIEVEEDFDDEEVITDLGEDL